MPLYIKGGAAAVVAALLLAAPSLAADPLANQVRVSRAWLTNDSPATSRRALNLLGRAAMEACGASTFSLPGYKDAVRHSPCWQQSMADALVQVGDPTLTNAFRRRAKVEMVRAEGGSLIRLR